MKHLRVSAVATAALCLLALLAPAEHASAFQVEYKSGCKGKPKEKDPNGNPAVWNVYKWPDTSSEVIATVPGKGHSFWVYRDYRSTDFYLVSICAREAGANCDKGDNTDDIAANNPKVGFIRKSAVNTLYPCHKHKPALPDDHRNAAGKAFRPGMMFRVRATEVYLRSVESGNEGHPYGLLRKGDRFVREKLSDDGEWMYGWAHTSSKGINPKMRYGKVQYRKGDYHYLTKE